jgi:hypothetical protein
MLHNRVLVCALQGPGRPVGPAGSLLVLEEAASELLDYLRCLDAASMAELTGSVGPEVSAAMDNFVARLMGTTDRDSLSRAGSDCTAQVGAGVGPAALCASACIAIDSL